MKAVRAPRTLSPVAQKVIAEVYLVGSVPADPHVVLQDISRSVSIVGRLLKGLADGYATVGKSTANIVTIAGSVLWAIVEVSVPGSVLFYLSRNWFKLVGAVGMLIIVLGAVTNTSGMPSVGIDLLVVAFLGSILSSQLHRFMNTGDVDARRVKTILVALVALFAIVGTLYLLLAHAQSIANTLQWIAGGFKWVAEHFHAVSKPKH